MKKFTFLFATIFFTFLNKVNAQICFAPAVNYSAHNNPFSITKSDFNGDGFIDLAIANADACTGDTVSVLLGNGSGTFSSPYQFSVVPCCCSIVSGDFNNDGNIDLVTAHNAVYRISTLLGVGNGSFLPSTSMTVANTPYFIETLDFNGDGNLDLVSANLSGNSISIFLGNGTGSFTPFNIYTVGMNCTSVAFADFNNDGITDLTTGFGGTNFISVLLGAGGGSMNPSTNFTVGTVPFSVTSGKFNNDNFSDIATISQISGSPFLSILLGNGTGSFTISNYSTTILGTHTLRNKDINGDGNLDLICTEYTNNIVAISLGNGNGTFNNPIFFPVGTSPRALTIADFNGDLKPDIATANEYSNNSSVLLSCNSLNIFEFTKNISDFIYPNPTSDLINIKTDIDLFELEIYNSIGQLIKKYSSTLIINVKDFAQGIYWVTLKSKDKFVVNKFIKSN